MLTKSKKEVSIEPKIFEIQWYPNMKSCVKINKRRVTPRLMPPLMVRKPEWRK
ncbi:MAG: hypothetical protein PHF37_07765 [Phycisphaerae bacterium]|nr:hypothetical protein [Phycisphaerae bacterium]